MAIPYFRTLLLCLALSAASSSLAATAKTSPAPAPHVQGPALVGQHLAVRGEAVGIHRYPNKTCTLFRVLTMVEDPKSTSSGGRVLVCPQKSQTIAIGTRWDIRGVVSSTQMVRMGPRWRPMPVINEPALQPLK